MSKKSSNDQIAAYLGQFLADTFVLYVKTLNFHWNMKGPEFFMFHKLLEQQYEDLAEGADTIAERIQMLGHHAPATMSEYLKLASMKEGASGLTQEQMVRELAQSHQTMVEHCHKLCELTEKAGDQGSNDLIVDQIRFHDKQAWLLKSHLKKA